MVFTNEWEYMGIINYIPFTFHLFTNSFDKLLWNRRYQGLNSPLTTVCSTIFGGPALKRSACPAAACDASSTSPQNVNVAAMCLMQKRPSDIDTLELEWEHVHVFQLGIANAEFHWIEDPSHKWAGHP